MREDPNIKPVTISGELLFIDIFIAPAQTRVFVSVSATLIDMKRTQVHTRLGITPTVAVSRCASPRRLPPNRCSRRHLHLRH